MRSVLFFCINIYETLYISFIQWQQAFECQRLCRRGPLLERCATHYQHYSNIMNNNYSDTKERVRQVFVVLSHWLKITSVTLTKQSDSVAPFLRFLPLSGNGKGYRCLLINFVCKLELRRAIAALNLFYNCRFRTFNTESV